MFLLLAPVSPMAINVSLYGSKLTFNPERDFTPLTLIAKVPTISESGLPGFEATSWYCIVAPAGVPKPIVTRLHTELVKILNSPKIRDRLIAEGADVETTTPEELMAFVRVEISKWAKAVKDSGAKLD
jgi:tripartite-type tricarboxylate transporter receptor subunit TctC